MTRKTISQIEIAPPDGEPRHLRETEFEDLIDLPDSWRYDSGLSHEQEQTESGWGNEESFEPPRQKPQWGDERHPALFVNREGKSITETSNPKLARHSCGETVNWQIGLEYSDIPNSLLDADRLGEGVTVRVFGVREGDTSSFDASIAEIEHVKGGVCIWLSPPPGERPTLYRWSVTGCLICGGGER